MLCFVQFEFIFFDANNVSKNHGCGFYNDFPE